MGVRGCNVETMNALQNAMIVSALLDRYEWEQEHDFPHASEACLRLLAQTKETVAYEVQVPDEVKQEVEQVVEA